MKEHSALIIERDRLAGEMIEFTILQQMQYQHVQEEIMRHVMRTHHL